MKIFNLGSLNIDYVYQVPHFVRPGETLSSSDLKLFPGEKGSLYKYDSTLIHQPIYKVKAIDTTAAGDTFTGFFLAAIIRGDSPKTTLQMAAAASSIAVSRPGASSSIPTLDEVIDFISH